MGKQKKAMTYGELKAALEGFTPEQLALPVRWSGDERGGPIQSVVVLDEDHVDLDGDGLEPASLYSEEDLEDVRHRYPAGTAFLVTDEEEERDEFATAPPKVAIPFS